ncbi:MAG: hypothetical protein WCT10_01935 [Patescibacteria group bacterium]|jgi:hypothetical protein
MTRIENEDQSDREALKKEILTEIHHEQRRKKLLGCAGCLVLELLAVAVPLLLSAALVAKTGLVTVPVLTGWLYEPSQPARQVLPLVGSTGEQIAKTAALKSKYDALLQSLEISFSEAELTTIIRGSLAAAGAQLPVALSGTQIAVDPGHLEFYGLIDRPDRQATVRADIEPVVQNGQLKIKVTGLRLGALDIPDGLSGLFASVLDRVIGEALTSAMSGLGGLNSIVLEPGRMRFLIHYVPR